MSSQASSLSRKWVPMVGGSCDVRMGPNALELSSKLFSGSVGKPKRALVVLYAALGQDLRERLRRQLVDAGFSVCWHEAKEGASCTFEAALDLATALAQEHMTADDLCCALGDASLISMASFVCGTWCAGMSLVAIPTDEVAFFEGALVPRSLDVAAASEVVSVRPCARHVLVDYDLVFSQLETECSRYARVLMVASAMAASEREFSALWDRADAIMAGDEGEFVTQLMATAKARGQIASSTAAAIRQSIDYGRDFARALKGLVQAALPPSGLLAEGLRFAARVSVMQEKLSLDDMLAQDELLEALGIRSLTCDVNPQALCDALHRERFLRTNRFMLLVPLAIGRVRLATVEDGLLLEHATAWCEAHKA